MFSSLKVLHVHVMLEWRIMSTHSVLNSVGKECGCYSDSNEEFSIACEVHGMQDLTYLSWQAVIDMHKFSMSHYGQS